MPKNFLADDVLQRGFDLAYFIHRDKETAMRVVADAAERLDVAVFAQDKRLYYHPKQRLLPRHATKVSLSRSHLFQRLIYIASEKYEKESEGNGARFDQRTMLVRFIKHVVRITLKRNSFYVALGVSRLIHNYTTAETMMLDESLQDSERGRDDCYYRSRKSTLMRELVDRFGDALRICRGAHGEERFQGVRSPARYAPLVKQSLEIFTPWDTGCSTRGPLIRAATDLEDEVEIRRMHSILHPACLQWLTRALSLASPDERGDAPAFAMAEDRNDEDRPAGGSPPLDSFDVSEIHAQLASRASSRRKMSSEVLRIVVDGVDRGRLNLLEPSDARFEIDSQSESIEICNGYGSAETRLAFFLVPHHGDGVASSTASRTLESGARLSVRVMATESGATVEVRCRPSIVQELIRFVSARPRALASLAVTIALIVFFGWLAIYREPKLADNRMKLPPSALIPREASKQLPIAETTRSTEIEKQASETAADFDKTRGVHFNDQATALSGKPAIYVEVQGMSSARRPVREAIVTAMQSVPGARITSADAASTALKVFIENQTPDGVLTVQARLVDVNGTVLWPLDGGKRTYRGQMKTVSQQLADDLREVLNAARR